MQISRKSLWAAPRGIYMGQISYHYHHPWTKDQITIQLNLIESLLILNSLAHAFNLPAYSFREQIMYIYGFLIKLLTKVTYNW